MLNTNPLLLPLLVLVAWTSVMWVWMFTTRIPAIVKLKMKFDPNAIRGAQMSTLPAHVRWKADNFSNLMEQPTVFFALILSLALMGDSSQLNYILAWVYVALRIVHSLIHSLINIVELRFCVYFLSGLVLIAMTINTFCQIYG